MPTVDINGPGLLDFKIPLVPDPQTVIVSFEIASDNVTDDTPSSYDISVEITTSDGQPLVSEVTVEVADLATGSAVLDTDYSFTSPTTVTFTEGSASGATETASVSVLGTNVTADADFGLQNAVGARITGGDFQLNLEAGGPPAP